MYLKVFLIAENTKDMLKSNTENFIFLLISKRKCATLCSKFNADIQRF